MKDLVDYVVRQLVDHPDDVCVEEMQEQTRTLLVIHANQEDMGKIIGKNGRIIRALRDLVKLVAAKRNLYADVEVKEGKTHQSNDH